MHDWLPIMQSTRIAEPEGSRHDMLACPAIDEFCNRETRRPATGNDHGRTVSKKELLEEPIREELFSVERMEQYATELAVEHRVTYESKRGLQLLPRLEDNGRELTRVYRSLAETIDKEVNISPAAEWLVDNFHIVEEQLREIRRDLPRSYYNELPKLQSGDLSGYPRVYAIALEIVAHTDSRLDAETLTRFIKSYQTVTPLSIGELWAIAITLRLVLVENLRRLATRIIAARNARDRADRLADKLLELAVKQPGAVLKATEDEIGSPREINRAFVVQLTRRLRDQDPEVWPAIEWIEKHLDADSPSIEHFVHTEHQRQAATQVTVGNIITSMRLLSTLDWREFFETVTRLDPILAEDPIGAYSLMDFTTRDRYRHVIEEISKQTHLLEHESCDKLPSNLQTRRTNPIQTAARLTSATI